MKTEQEYVRKLRSRLGLSTAEFAGLAGVSPRTVEDWEQGRRNPSGSAMIVITSLAADKYCGVPSALRKLKVKKTCGGEL